MGEFQGCFKDGNVRDENGRREGVTVHTKESSYLELDVKTFARSRTTTYSLKPSK